MSNSFAEARKYKEFIAEPDSEDACRAELREYLTRVRQEPVDMNVEQLFSLESGVCDRFNYFAPRMPESARRRLLVSGCAVGTEMIIARQYGYEDILGTEVAPEYVQMTSRRFHGQEGFRVILYDGRNLPFENDTFTAVISGHIIEHTPSPYDYLREHIRILGPGGFLFLEFPNRYHRTELHTGLPSLEYLPMPLRSLGLRYRASRFSRFSPAQRERYTAILETLQPVSVWQIKMYLSRMDCSRCRVVHHYSPAPGITRLLIAK